jgi:short-subunit dehydrogenase
MIDAKKYGPWAIVAGASEGVGASFARLLGAAALNLVLIARKQAVLEDVASQVRAASGVQVRILPVDLTSSDMLDRIRAVTDDIEVGLVVYNAGANQSMQRFFDGTLDNALRVVRLNPVGQVTLAHHFGKKMLARGRGGIILIGSLAGSAGGSPLAAYSGSKAFAQKFAEGLWSEGKPQGVDVLYIVLGAVDTPNRARQSLSDKAKRKDALKPEDDPNQMVFPPDEIAQAALDNIANGPVHVPERLNRFFHQLTTLPRAEASHLMSRMLRGFSD